MKNKIDGAIFFPWERKVVDPLDPHIKQSKQILGLQIFAICWLCVVYLIYKIFGQYVPEFNFASLWSKTTDLYGSVLRYWYIFAWGVGLSILIPITNGSAVKANKLFVYDLITSTLAGIWEEIGYRGLFIFTAMISVIIANLFFKYLLVIVIACIVLGIIIKMTNANLLRIIFLIGGVVLIVYVLRANFVGDPLYWFYRSIMFPIWHFVSFGLLDPILYHKDFSFLFIVGAMSANFKFRDGHKYQGLFGYINSWIIGYILLHAMMYYGLYVAIIIHAIYDILIGVTVFVKRRLIRD